MSQHPITEHDIQAFVDDALSESRCAEVAEYLETHPDEAERVAVYRSQKNALQALFQPVLDEAVPDRLQHFASVPAAVDVRKRPFLARWSLERIAAGVLVAALGGVAGWLAHSHLQPVDIVARVTPLPKQAAVAHVVFSPDVRRPVEVGAEQEEQLIKWLS